MSDQEKLWAHVQRALDERRDPLADPELEAWLLEDDQALDEVLRLRSTLSVLEATATPVAPRWRRSVALAACVTALLVGGGLLLESPLGPQPAGNPDRGSLAPEVAGLLPNTPTARVLEVSISVVTESEDACIATHYDGHEFTRRKDRFASMSVGDSARRSDTVISTLVSQRYSR